jgi:hypothetical protein
MHISHVAALAAVMAVSVGDVARAQAPHAGPSWKPEGNVEFVVGAGAGG